MATATHQLADMKLGGPGELEGFVRLRRTRPKPRAWRLIARDVYEATGLDITYETLRSWFPDEPIEVAS